MGLFDTDELYEERDMLAADVTSLKRTIRKLRILLSDAQDEIQDLRADLNIANGDFEDCQ